MSIRSAPPETPFGGTIAHGFLTLSLLSAMAFETVPPLEGTEHGHQLRLRQAALRGAGQDRRAHPRPIRAGRRQGAAVRLDPGEHDITIEIEDAKKPALTARWLTLVVPERKEATGVSDPNVLDEAASRPYLEAQVAGFSGLATIEKFNAGQSNPTYLVTRRSGRYVLRAKPPGELLKSAHQVDREYPRDEGAGRDRVPVPRHAAPVAGRFADRPHVLRHGTCRGPHLLGPGPAGASEQRRARGDLRRHERDAGRACTRSMSRPSGLPISAGRAAISSASCRAGRASTAPPRPRRSPTWTG